MTPLKWQNKPRCNPALTGRWHEVADRPQPAAGNLLLAAEELTVVVEFQIAQDIVTPSK